MNNFNCKNKNNNVYLRFIIQYLLTSFSLKFNLLDIKVNPNPAGGVFYVT